MSGNPKLQTLKSQHWSLLSPMFTYNTIEFVILILVLYQPISNHYKHLHSHYLQSLITISIILGLVSIVLLD